jgi:hypothetical protein
LKRVHQKIVVSKFLAKAKEGERVQKDGGWGQVGNHGFPDSSFCFFV